MNLRGDKIGYNLQLVSNLFKNLWMFRNIDILIGDYNLFQGICKNSLFLLFNLLLQFVRRCKEGVVHGRLLCTAPGRCAPIRGNNGRCTADGIA